MVLYSRGSTSGGTVSVFVSIVFPMLCCSHGVHQVTLSPMFGHCVWVGSNSHVGHATGAVPYNIQDQFVFEL